MYYVRDNILYALIKLPYIRWIECLELQRARTVLVDQGLVIRPQIFDIGDLGTLRV